MPKALTPQTQNKMTTMVVKGYIQSRVINFDIKLNVKLKKLTDIKKVVLNLTVFATFCKIFVIFWCCVIMYQYR